MKASHKWMTVSGLMVAGLALGVSADRAEAQYFFAPAPVVYSAPVYVAPAPVYMAPRPVYYAPPVYVASRPVGYYPRSFGFSFGYASYGRHHRYHRHHGRGFGFSFGCRR